MNSSMCRADANTHARIVATALLAAIVVVWIGIAARISPDAGIVVAPMAAGPSMVAAIETGRF